MSARRREVARPFAGQAGVCCFCGASLPKGRRAWCGDDCVERYQIATGDQNAARRFCWSRDFGVCRLCGTDTVDPREIEDWYGRPIPRHHLNHRHGRWDADHIVPIVEGGELTRENLRTLCRPCHRSETRALRARLAAKRRAQAGPPA